MGVEAAKTRPSVQKYTGHRIKMHPGHPSPSGISLPDAKLGEAGLWFSEKAIGLVRGRQEKALAAKPGDPRSIPGTHTVEGEDTQKAHL